MKVLLSVQKFLFDSVDTFLSILKIGLLSKFFLKPRSKTKNTGCIILANGPSLLDSLQKHGNRVNEFELICVNHFAEQELYPHLKPGIYVLNAPETWMDDVEPYFIEKGEKLFNAIKNNTQWPVKLFIPFSAKKFIRWRQILQENKNITIHYFNTTPIEGFKEFRYACYNKFLGMPRPHNVLIPSLMISISLGFTSINLLGADHSWLKDLWVNDQNQVLLKQKHFYDAEKAIGKPMDFLGKGSRKLHEVLLKFVYGFKGYFEINEYCKKKNIQILNCTPGSYIDAFKRSSELIK